MTSAAAAEMRAILRRAAGVGSAVSGARSEGVLPQHEEGRQRQHRVEHIGQRLAGHQQIQMRPAPGAEKRRRHARKREFPVDKALSGEAEGRQRRAAGGGELVGGHGVVGGQPRD